MAISEVVEWNREALWRVRYEGRCDGLTLFAEDVFGTQLGVDARGAVFQGSEAARQEWGMRLFPRRLFILGGDFAVEN